MADIFISYASEDRDRVRPLAEALQQRGFSVWWDRALGSGEDYASVIERELAKAKAVVVVWTRSSVLSNFVRDEAGRARDQGRLAPVMLDRVDLPLGFGAFQAEDFTAWNGSARAAQMQILEEALKAKIEGRDIDGDAVARKRRRLMGRIRIVSLLTVVALLVAIAVGLNNILNPAPPPTDLRAELLRLLEEGALTPEQAIQLAQLLEAGALGEAAAAIPGEEQASVRSGDATLTTVSEAEFDAAARETYQQAMQQLLAHPDPQVRTAAANLSVPERRDQAMQTLWDHAREDPEAAPAIYEVCGAVGTVNDLPLGQQALEYSTNLAPQDAQNWRLLSYSYQRSQRGDAARAAALVGEAVVAEQAGQEEVAEQRLEQALTSLPSADTRAFVSSRLGALAERRNDWGAATQRYEQAYEARQQAAEAGPLSVTQERTAQAGADAQRYVRALDRSGNLAEACTKLAEAQEELNVEAPDEALVERCERHRVRILPRLEIQRRAPALELQRATEPQRTAPEQ